MLLLPSLVRSISVGVLGEPFRFYEERVSTSPVASG